MLDLSQLYLCWIGLFRTINSKLGSGDLLESFRNLFLTCKKQSNPNENVIKWWMNSGCCNIFIPFKWIELNLRLSLQSYFTTYGGKRCLFQPFIPYSTFSDSISSPHLLNRFHPLLIARTPKSIFGLLNKCLYFFKIKTLFFFLIVIII